jgi:DNA-directed RNA polymerase subunit RPC12/RpoP
MADRGREKHSQVMGDGHGSAHMWVRLHTDQVGDRRELKCTYYRCADCGSEFGHHYGLYWDIFEEMKLRDVPSVCDPPLVHAEGTVHN